MIQCYWKWCLGSYMVLWTVLTCTKQLNGYGYLRLQAGGLDLQVDRGADLKAWWTQWDAYLSLSSLDSQDHYRLEGMAGSDAYLSLSGLDVRTTTDLKAWWTQFSLMHISASLVWTVRTKLNRSNDWHCFSVETVTVWITTQRGNTRKNIPHPSPYFMRSHHN